MKKLLMLVLLMAFPATAFAQQSLTDTLTWILPTAREDGTPFASTEVASVKIRWSTSPGGAQAGEVVVNGPATSTSLTRTGPGLRCYTALVVDTGGLESDPSAEVCKRVNAKPRPITGLTVR
jgi:hypothetical protein